MRLRFTIRDLLWLTLVVAMGIGWWVDHLSFARQKLAWESLPPHFPHADDATKWLLLDLDNATAEIRAMAVDLLAARKAKEAVPKLIDLLADGTALNGSDNFVGGHAANALEEITGRHAEPHDVDQMRWKQWWAEQLRQ